MRIVCRPPTAERFADRETILALANADPPAGLIGYRARTPVGQVT